MKQSFYRAVAAKNVRVLTEMMNAGSQNLSTTCQVHVIECVS